VGKTAVAEAIAEALGLPFVRISLAGHCDIPALKGSAYTWNSSGIGYLAQALIAAGAENLVMLLDEADKSGGYANSTVSNLYAEILDPDQAHRYQDLFLPGLEIDLSQVQFVLTANDIRAVPDFATNRCKVIRLRSYTADERLTIIRDFFPQQIVGARRLGFTIFVAPDIARRLAAEAESLREARRMLTEMVAWAIEQKEPGSFESLTIDTWDDCVLDADGDSGQQIGFRP